MIPSVQSFGNICLICSKPTEMQKHDFFKGSPETPEKRWTYYAPLYHMPDKLIGFCDAICSTKYYEGIKNVV